MDGGTDLVRHPGSLNFEIAPAHPTDDGSQVGLGIDHFDDVG